MSAIPENPGGAASTAIPTRPGRGHGLAVGREL